MAKSNIMNDKRDIFSYTIWGVVGTILNIGIFRLLILNGIDYQIANVFTLIITKIFTYVTNKLLVFRTPYIDLRYCLKEMSYFFLARGFTFIVDFAGVVFIVEIMGGDAFLGKCFMAVIVIVLNYVLSKKIVFKEKGEKHNENCQ